MAFPAARAKRLQSRSASSDPRVNTGVPKQTRVTAKVAKLFRFYKPLSDDHESEIWKLQRDWIRQPCVVPDDERVEDAGLELEPVAA